MFILKLRTLRGRGLNKPAQVWKTTKDIATAVTEEGVAELGEQLERRAVREGGSDLGGFTNHTPLCRGATSSQDSFESQA